jgi:mono/diheme cytochrome c family protein
MKQLILLAIAASLSTLSWADVPHGKELHDEHCTKCHDDSVYKRPDRFISSKEALDKQVTRCGLNSGAQWFDEDVADVVDYLNSTYYHFK